MDIPNRGTPSGCGGRDSVSERSAVRIVICSGMAIEHPARPGWPSSAARCRTSPASTCSATRAGGSSTSARPSRSASASPRISRHSRAGTLIDHIESLVVAHRGRGAAHRAELHQAVQAALQHPAARRQVVSVHRDHARRGLPSRVLHARAPPPRPRLLRAVLERQAGPRHARPARQGLPVPLLRRRGPGRRSGSPCLDYYIKRCGAPCVGYVSKEEYRESIDGVVAFLSGRYKQIERDLEQRMYFAAGEQDFEQAAIERNRLQAVRSLLERQRVANERLGHVRRGRRRGRGRGGQRPGLPGPRRRALGPPVLLPRQRGRARSRRRRRGVHACSTTRARCRSRR